MLKLWSALPYEAYSVTFAGAQYGIGARELWKQIPGAWNILQLVWNKEVEALLEWSGDLEKFPLNCGYVPYAVAFALQQASPDRTWGEIATLTNPSQFLQLLKEHPNKDDTALIVVSGEMFWSKAQELVENYKDLNGNVIQHDFRAATRVQ